MADNPEVPGQEPDATPQDGERDYEAEIAKLRSEAAKYRVERNELRGKVEELSPQAERLAKLEEAQKTEAEKLADQLAELKAQQTKAAQEAERARAEAKLVRLAAKAGVDPDIASLLDISKLDLEDEDAVMKTLSTIASPRANGGGASNPEGEGQGKPSDEELRDYYFGGGRNKVTLFGG